MLKYYPNVVLFDEEKANGVGIITGWKTPRLIHDELSSDALEKVVSIGPLYTKNGINFIIANLFLNPQISHLLLLEDSDVHSRMCDSIREFLYFLETEDIRFQKKFQFSKENIHEFCEYFKNHVTVVSSDRLNDTIEKLPTTASSLWRDGVEEFSLEVVETKQNAICTIKCSLKAIFLS